MTRDELERVLAALPDKTVLVLGDYFLDKYLLIDPAKDEPSIETGLTAYQVVGKRMSPGAAGTVTNNLRALGVGKVVALGVVGDDGEGLELRRGLRQTGVVTDELIVSPERVTPTYTKPMRMERGNERELNRLDIKNWSPTPDSIQDEIIAKLHKYMPDVDAVIVMDQVSEPDHGAVTGKVREALSQLCEAYSAVPVFADSRAYISRYRNVLIKVNHREALAAAGANFSEAEADLADPVLIHEAGKMMERRTGKPVFITHGAKGQYVIEGGIVTHVPGVPVQGPIDIVGAGDSTTAGIVSALCAGMPLKDAALFGNIVASITIQQIGTTGTASPEQVMKRYEEYMNLL